MTKIIEWWHNLLLRKKTRRYEHQKKQAEEVAEELFQVCECDNSLWFVYKNELVCPMSMFSDPVINALHIMRRHYVEMNTTPIDQDEK